MRIIALTVHDGSVESARLLMPDRDEGVLSVGGMTPE
jgi:hypothetical protein